MPARRTAEFPGWSFTLKTLSAARNPTPPLKIDFYNILCLQWAQGAGGGTVSDIEIWMSANESDDLAKFAGDPGDPVQNQGQFFRLKNDAGVAITFPDLPAGVNGSSGGITFSGVAGAYVMLVFVVSAGVPNVSLLSHVKEHGA